MTRRCEYLLTGRRPRKRDVSVSATATAMAAMARIAPTSDRMRMCRDYRPPANREPRTANREPANRAPRTANREPRTMVYSFVVRALGIDYGTRRIGLALSDATGLLARPWKTIAASGGPAQVAAVLVAEVRALTEESDGLAAIAL